MTITINTSDTAITDTAADRALKAKHAAMWASGNYSAVVTDVVAPLGGILVDAVGVRAGLCVLDVAAGTGTAALPAARRGATVTAIDLTPELLAVGRADAAAEGVDLTWQTADAEALPFPDAEFDAVVSAIGVMFAPHHQLAADELLRVCRPAGTVGVLSWTPEGFIGQMFAVMKPYAPSPTSWRLPGTAVGECGPRPAAVRGGRDRSSRPPAVAVGHPVRRRRGVPRLLQGQLRPDDRGLPLHRR